jgi:general secretion pathway protein D
MNATDSRVNVLSSPHIMVADNQQAKIQVGNSVPTPGQTLVSGTGPSITSTQYLDTGIILTVTPRISAGGVVNLDVQQEVSDASTATGATAPTISKRTVKSIVTVQSGETTILGGLIKEDKGFSTDGIPLLSQIPVIGALFGSQGYKKAKTELVVLITPRIASNVSQAKAITEEFRKKLGGVEEMMLGLQKEKEVMDARR